MINYWRMGDRTDSDIEKIRDMLKSLGYVNYKLSIGEDIVISGQLNSLGVMIVQKHEPKLHYRVFSNKAKEMRSDNIFGVYDILRRYKNSYKEKIWY